MFRVGFAKDIHRLVKGRPLILGGVTIPFELGEDAHSDGDVVYHSLSEAMLGSLALGDLGTFYPTDDDKYLNIDSSYFVKGCYKKVLDKGYSIVNIDISINLEKPKLKPYLQNMRENISSLLEIDIKNISIKAMTNEKLDSVGENKAVESYCYLLIKKN
ncbi:MAG: 2-C-methyl-D-erythritol 2,4-cyclodiphosphate synthase [Bacilli bacterium]